MTFNFHKCSLFAILVGLVLVGFPAWADQDGVGLEKISLPSGPGSIEGLGGAFEPQLNTGTASYGFPIAVIPGRGGMQPSLGISYNGGQGNSSFGIGWGMGVAAITRQTEKGLPRYGPDDRFTMGGEELIPLSDGSYRLENEGSFTKAVPMAGDNGWIVYSANGTKSYLGISPQSRIINSDRPENFNSTFKWRVEKVVDVHGNAMTYDYTTFPDSPGQSYLREIRYSLTGTDSNPSAYHYVRVFHEGRDDVMSSYVAGFERTLGRRCWKIEVGSFYGGSERLVRRYLLDYKLNELDPIEYYENTRGADAELNLSLLRQITQYDNNQGTQKFDLTAHRKWIEDGFPQASGNFLPPVRFGYSRLSAANVERGRLENLPLIGWDNRNLALADMNADALPDLFYTDPYLGTHTVYYNEGEGRFAAGTDFANPPGLTLENDSVVTLADYDGDARIDLVHKSGWNFFQYYPNTTAPLNNNDAYPSWGQPVDFDPTYNYPSFNLNDPNVRSLDLDNDKRMDFIRTVYGMGTVHYLNKGTYWVASNFNYFGVSGDDISYADGINFSDTARIRLADMNGDRLLDIVRVFDLYQQVEITWWPNKGFGKWGTRQVISPEQNPIELGLRPLEDLHFMDVNGDGLADTVLLDYDNVQYWINQGDGQFSKAFHIANTPEYIRGETVTKFADINGNGSTDIIWSNWDTNAGGFSAEYVDFIAKPVERAPSVVANNSSYTLKDFSPYTTKPNLLRLIDNGIGLITEIDYRPSTDYYSAARKGDNPWATRLPFASWCVSAITQHTGLDLDQFPGADTYVSEFSYHDGYYDPIEKEFRGFAFARKVSRGDDRIEFAASPDQIHAPSSISRMAFHTGVPDGLDNDGDGEVDEYDAFSGYEEEALKGRVLWSETTVLTAEFDQIDNDGDGYIDESDEGPLDGQTAANAVTFGRSSTTWALRTLHTADGGFTETDANGSSVNMNWLTMDQRKITLAYPFEAYAESIEAVGTLHVGNPWAAGANPITTRVTTDTNYFGQNTSVTEHGIIAGAATTSTGTLTYQDERVTEIDYLYDTANWILGLSAEARLLDLEGTLHSRSRMFYDDQAFGALAGKGLLTATTAFVGSSATAIDSFTALPGDPRLVGEGAITSRIEYGAYGNPVKIMDPLHSGDDSGHARSMTFDTTFHQYVLEETVLSDSDSPNLTASANYDYASGTVIDSTDFNGHVTSYQYDSFYRPVSSVRPGDTLTAPSAPSVQFSYTPADPIRYLTYTYDAEGGLTLSGNDDPYGLSQVATKMRETHGGTTFDAWALTSGAGQSLGTITEAEDGQYVFSDLVDYTSNGQVRNAYLPFFGDSVAYIRPTASTEYISNFYDPAGRAIRTIKPPEEAGSDARSFTEVLHLPGKTVSFDEEDTASDGLHTGTPSMNYADGLGRGILAELATRTTVDGQENSGTLRYLSTSSEFNLQGALVRFTDPQQNVKWVRYDQLGRMIYLQDPNRGSLEFSYDAAGNLKERIDNKAQRINFSYDSLNRLKVEDYVDASALPEDVEYFYDVATTIDQGDGSSAANTNTLGRLSYIRDLTGGHYFSYDERGRSEWAVKSIIDPVTGVETAYRTGLSYDAMDRVRSHTFPDGDQVDYAYNDRSLLESITAGSVNILEEVNYRAEGNLLDCTYGNSVSTSYQYDPRQRLRRITTVGQGDPLLDYRYDRDAVGNITGMADLRDLSGEVDAVQRNNTRTGRYDDLYRLREAQINGLNTLSYTFDDLNNLLEKSALSELQDKRGLEVANVGSMNYGGIAGSTGRGSDNLGKGTEPGPHAITQAGVDRSFSYDANGNMTSGDGMTLSWDVLDRLLSVETANNFSQYDYDYTGRRIAKRVYAEAPVTPQTQPESSTTYVDGTYEIRDGQPIKYVHHNGKRVARITRQLSPGNDFVQRIPLQPGWNIVALAVEGVDLSVPTEIEGVHLLDPDAGTLTELANTGSGYQIPAGSLLWLEVSEYLTWSIKGAPINGPALAAQNFEPGKHWIMNFGTQSISLDQLPPAATLWTHDATAQRWSHRLTGKLAEAAESLALLQSLSEQILPGQVALGLFDTSFTLEPIDPDLEIRYYHTDHLGSSSVMTTASGELAYEHYYLPYGSTRFEFTPKGITEPYGYIGKEQDLSTGLHYVEARYLLSGLGTFVSVDPLENALGGPWTPYGYTSGNPWTMFDPLGLQALSDFEDPEVELDTSVDLVVETPKIDVKEPEPDYSFTPPVVETSPDDSAKPDDFDLSKYRVPEGFSPRQGLSPNASLEEIEQSMGLSGSDLRELQNHYENGVARGQIQESLPMFILAWGGASAGNVRVGTGPRLNVQSPAASSGSGWGMINPGKLTSTHGLTLSPKQFAKLKADISKNGIKTPVRVHTYKGQKYIVNGHHRARAARELGIDEVPIVEQALPYRGYHTTLDLMYSR
jgi:RHS repeat-associated protein